jgi:hypothetical protein
MAVSPPGRNVREKSGARKKKLKLQGEIAIKEQTVLTKSN